MRGREAERGRGERGWGSRKDLPLAAKVEKISRKMQMSRKRIMREMETSE